MPKPKASKKSSNVSEEPESIQELNNNEDQNPSEINDENLRPNLDTTQIEEDKISNSEETNTGKIPVILNPKPAILGI